MVLRARTDGSVLVFDLEGQLDFEATEQLQQAYSNIRTKHADNPVVFNLGRLRFVGSSSINHFIRVLRDFCDGDVKPKFCQLSPEFDRLFRAFQSPRHPFHIYPQEPEAVAACVEEEKLRPPKLVALPVKMAPAVTMQAKKKKKTAVATTKKKTSKATAAARAKKKTKG